MRGHFTRTPEALARMDDGRTLAELRHSIDDINLQLLSLLSRRAQLAQDVAQLKERTGRDVHDPERELTMLDALVGANEGPLPDHVVAELFQDIFRHSRRFMEQSTREALEVSRIDGRPDAVIEVKGHRLGESPVVIAGPCSVESRQQLDETARFLASRGVRWLRGGAWKPRTSPYDFQGLGEPALELLAEVGHRYGLATVTEVVDTRQVALAARFVDVLQVGARNMQNFELLKELGGVDRPVLLKRGPAATLQELLKAAEYVVARGNRRVILCERGVRGFERETRYTLDISAVPLLRQMTWLPVVVDVSHAAGRRDILPALGRAALAAGAQGVMVEVHPRPAVALSDSQQQLDFDDFDDFHQALGLSRTAPETHP